MIFSVDVCPCFLRRADYLPRGLRSNSLMSNTRKFNKRVEQRARKRLRSSVGGSYHDRVVDDDDYEIVHSRESHLSSRGLLIETPRSPQRGLTAWVVGEDWAPADDPEVGLDPEGDWFDEECEKDVTDPPRPVPKRKKKSRTSVSHTSMPSPV